MKRIGASYVYWYNKKYERVGHLFQGRYKSEEVEDEIYFKTVVKYIHQNPVKAGYVKKCEEYQWSSYDPEGQSLWILSLFSKNKSEAIKLYRQFHKVCEKTKCLDIERDNKRISDENAIEILKAICDLKNCKELQKQEQETRDENIKKIIDKGISIRQLSRLTGLPRKMIYLKK